VTGGEEPVVTMPAMDVRIGARFRALRHRLGWRQSDLAARAGVSAGVVSLIERGRLERVSLAKLRRVAATLEAEFVVQLRWRGGDLDRLVDEGHAALVGATATMLTSAGWLVRIEVSYSIYGERGSIDILAWHPATRTLLVVEVKTELTSVEETLRRHDAKGRLAGRIAADQFTWTPAAVRRLLVLPEHATPRRRVERHRAVLDTAYPMRGHRVRASLRSPAGTDDGLMFITVPDHASRRPPFARKRVRCRERAH